MSSRIVFRISGLCCGVEGATLCSVVMVQDGVLNVEVDGLSSRLSVTYDGRRITRGDHGCRRWTGNEGGALAGGAQRSRW